MEIGSIVIFTILVILSAGFIWLFPTLVVFALLGLLWGAVVLSVGRMKADHSRYMGHVGKSASRDASQLVNEVSHYTNGLLSDAERAAKRAKETGGR